MMEAVRKVVVLFKTDFDYGYTALAEDIYERCMTHYIPAALQRAAETAIGKIQYLSGW